MYEISSNFIYIHARTTPIHGHEKLEPLKKLVKVMLKLLMNTNHFIENKNGLALSLTQKRCALNMSTLVNDYQLICKAIKHLQNII